MKPELMSQTSSGDNLESLRREYEQMAQLAGGLAHELRNPLSTVCLNLEILKEDLKEAETASERRVRQRVDSIREECRRLEELLNEFLQFTRGLELTSEPTDLSQLIEKFIAFEKPQAAAAHVDISQHLASDLPPVLLDTRQFKSVLENLTRNAIQAMPHGGVLEFQTYAKDGAVFLDIIDSGEGIPEKNRGKIFSLFFSTKSAGSGLGLPTVRKIVEAHGGQITCESELGRGTRFQIELPVA